MSVDQGDVSAAPAVEATAASASSRAALIARLADRQAEARSAVQQRRQRHEQHLPGGGGLATEFLGTFLRTKADILGDLEAGQTALLAQQQPAKIHQVTEFIDSILLRIEALQKTLNDCAPYLTHFDIEQARTELKTLNSEFQAKREQILPTKKFSFSRTPTKSITTTTTNPPCHQPPANESPRDNKSPPIAATDNPVGGFDERFSLVGLQNESLKLPRSAVTSSSETTLDKSVYLADLINCQVQVTCVSGNLVARRLRNCLVSAYPVAGSVWLEDCTDCCLLFACRQLRVHATHRCRLGLHTASRPIIEACSDLLVGPYPLNQFDDEQQLVEVDMPLAGLRRDVNFWHEVDDFSHPNKRLTTGSPNWSAMPREEWASLRWTMD